MCVCLPLALLSTICECCCVMRSVINVGYKVKKITPFYFTLRCRLFLEVKQIHSPLEERKGEKEQENSCSG